MSGLTFKQEKFCNEYLETGNATEAYRRSYNCENMKPASIQRKAKDMMEHGKISASIEKRQAPIREKVGITLESHLKELGRLRELAVEAGKINAAVAAEVARGKAAGLHRDKIDLSVAANIHRMSDQELLAIAAGGES